MNTLPLVMVSEARREAIRRHYRMLRAAAGKTQLEVSALARLLSGRYWKIENGYEFPTDEERPRLARVLKVDPAELPYEDINGDAAPKAVNQ